MMSDREQAEGLWAPSRPVILVQLLMGVVLLGLAATNLAGDDPTGWERFNGLLQALVAGLALGVGLSLVRQDRMVRRHMAAQHPGVGVPSTAPVRPRRREA